MSVRMKCSHRMSYLGLLLLQIWASALILLHCDFLGIASVFLLTYFLVFPGFLLLRLMGISLSSRFNQLVHSVGLSLSIFMFGGLFLNTLLPLIGIPKPLTQLNVILFLNVCVVGIGFVSYSKEKQKRWEFQAQVNDVKTILLSIIPILFIVQALAGAQTLNNGGSSSISVGLLIEIILYCLVIALLGDRFNRKTVYPLALFSISASLLLMLSMRSYHVVGFDINQELYVFQLTKRSMLWSMSSFQNAYNSCLSITILPTMLSYVSGINDEYVFKLLYPLIFSFAPVGMYYMVKGLANENIAFLSALVFIVQPSFILEMPMLARQEIGIVFLVLLFSVLFSNRLPEGKKATLLVVYYFSLVVSLYSTTYIAMFSFLMLFVITTIRRILKTSFPTALKI
jgi:uncharacterized membrane protein